MHIASVGYLKLYVIEVWLKWKQKISGMTIPLQNTTAFLLQFSDEQAGVAGDEEIHEGYLEYIIRKLKDTYEE